MTFLTDPKNPRLCHFSAWDHWSRGDGCSTGLHHNLFLFVARVPWHFLWNLKLDFSVFFSEDVVICFRVVSILLNFKYKQR